MTTPAEPAAYFERIDDTRFRPTLATEGAWSTAEQHISPMIGLVVHAVDGFVAARGTGPDMDVVRIGCEILGVVGFEEFEVHVEAVRPGRTVELLDVTVVYAGRAAVRARVWRMARADTSQVAGGAAAALPDPEPLDRWDPTSRWPGHYIASLDARPVGDPTPGRTTVWLSTSHALVAGEEASDLARFVALVDTANGIAVRESPQEWLFPNVDLTLHFHRQPTGDWTGLDTTVVFGPAGHGVTSTVLHDVEGAVGRAEQMLTVRPR